MLSHYNLEPNRNQILRCPFHEDDKASMRVYAETNTVHCFGGSYKGSKLDVIDFVMRMEASTKHAAIKKCEELLGGQTPRNTHDDPPKCDY